MAQISKRVRILIGFNILWHYQISAFHQPDPDPTEISGSGSVALQDFDTHPTVLYMVLISYGNAKHDAHARNKIGLIGEIRIRFVTALDLIECLRQIQ